MNNLQQKILVVDDDMENINHLIGETLSISLDLEEENVVPIDIVKELDNIINTIQKNGVCIKWLPEKP